eukprot:156053_1
MSYSVDNVKVIHVGFHKAGSSTVAAALKRLGFAVWHSVNNSYSQNLKGMKWWIQNEVYDKIDTHTFTEKDLDQWLSIIKCDCLMDVPIISDWKLFLKYCPNAKVIVTTRDHLKMHKSSVGLLHLVSHWSCDFILCNVPFGVGKMYYFFKHKYIPRLLKKNGYHSVKDWIHSDEDRIHQRYSGHINEVKQMVSPNRLLIFDVKQNGWEELCQFLNVKVPKNIPFPHKNKGNDQYKSKEALIILT